WARRKTRASFVCFNTVSKAERASLGKWSWRVRMALLFSLKYYKNTKICHDIVQLFSYQSKPFQLEFSRSCFSFVTTITREEEHYLCSTTQNTNIIGWFVRD